MASVHRRRPSTAASVRSDFHDGASNVSTASYMLTNDRNEYSDDHIKILYDIVVRAEELLPTLPESYRRPIPALLKAYNEVLPEYGIHPEDDQQITKLVFKVGGVFGRGSLMEKFRTALSRMNITLELDVPQLRPGETGDEYTDSFSISDDVSMSHGAQSHPASGEEGDDEYPVTNNGRDDHYYHAGETTDDYTIPRDEGDVQLDENDSYTIPRSDHDAHFNVPARRAPGPARDADTAQFRIEQSLEYSAIAFHNRYHAKFSVVAALRQWQRYSESLNLRWSQYREALEFDMVGVVEDTFRAWRIISAEAQEVLPPYLPSNIYSKRTEQIAIRTYQILATKNAFSRWRRRNKERSRKQKREAKEEPLDPLGRVALKAHENLMLSRAFVRWSNRSSQESKKSRVAAKIYEMSLKSKAFGSRRRPDETLLDSTPPGKTPEPAMAPLETAPAPDEEDELSYRDGRSDEMQQKAEMARKLFLMRSLAKRAGKAGRPGRGRVDAAAGNEEITSDGEDDRLREARHSAQVTRQLSSIKALAIRSKKPAGDKGNSRTTKDRATNTKSDLEKPVPGGLTGKSNETIDDELDERTLLARRHILRMRFFSAWEKYTLSHVTKAKGFAVRKTIEPWRERAVEIHDTESAYSEDRHERLLRGAIHAWARESSRSKHIEEKTERAERRLRVEHILKPWIAASREKQKLLEKKSLSFNVWFDHEDNDGMLAVMAAQVHFSLRAQGALRRWQTARDEKSARRTVFKTYGDRAVYYYNVTGALRAWKAAAKEAAVRRSMKREALETWREACRDELPRQEEMRSWAGAVNLSYSAARTVPVWRARAARAAEAQQGYRGYADRADYYYRTKGTLSAWRALAEARRKENIRKAHSEARRRVKRAMGERCVAGWRAALRPRSERLAALGAGLDDAVAGREWRRAAGALGAWRERALELARARSDAAAEAHGRAGGAALGRWRGAAADRRHLRAAVAAGYRQRRAAARALRGWGLGALQRAGRKHTVADLCDKRDRRRLRLGFEGWYARAAADILGSGDGDGDGDGGGDDGIGGVVGVVGGGGDDYYASGAASQMMLEQTRQQRQQQLDTTQTQARGLLHNWQAQAAATAPARFGGGVGVGVGVDVGSGAGSGGGRGRDKGKGKAKANARNVIGANTIAGANANNVNANANTIANANTNANAVNANAVNANANVNMNMNMQPPEDDVYVPTPGRPRLPLFGSLIAARASNVSTTPLAPVPNRGGGGPSWHPYPPAGAADGRSSVIFRGSVMRGGHDAGAGAGFGASARASRSRRNLRVSWAD